MEYKYVEERKPKNLVEEVKRAIKDGWVPLGSPVVVWERPAIKGLRTPALEKDFHLYQFMTKG
jgi:hypothetical protein